MSVEEFAFIHFKTVEVTMVPVTTVTPTAVATQNVVAMPAAGTAMMMPLQPPSYQESVGDSGQIFNVGPMQNQGASVVTPPV